MERGASGCVQVHQKIIHALNLSSLSPDSYDCSPISPGYHFHQWMSLGPPLSLPIAETVLCHGHGGITVLRTDPTNGYVVREHHPLATEASNSDETEVDLQFIRRCLERVVGESVPLISLPSVYNLPLPKAAGQQMQGLVGGVNDNKRLLARCAVECIDLPADASSSYAYPTQHEKLQHRFVAVLKRPVFNPRSAYTPDLHNTKNNHHSHSHQNVPADVPTRNPHGSDGDDCHRKRGRSGGHPIPATHSDRHSGRHSGDPTAPSPPLVIANDTELLQPLAFHAHLLNAVYGKHATPGGADGGGGAGTSTGRERGGGASQPVLILQK